MATTALIVLSMKGSISTSTCFTMSATSTGVGPSKAVERATGVGTRDDWCLCSGPLPTFLHGCTGSRTVVERCGDCLRD